MKGWLSSIACIGTSVRGSQTPQGIPVVLQVSAPQPGASISDLAGLLLRVEHAKLRLLRGFEELLSL
mgnify:CR=1 FL=1